VEGAESSVLESIDFSRFTASVFVIETREGQEDVQEEVHNLMTKNGYAFLKVERDNMIYILKAFE
jgi:hypothetical protein